MHHTHDDNSNDKAMKMEWHIGLPLFLFAIILGLILGSMLYLTLLDSTGVGGAIQSSSIIVVAILFCLSIYSLSSLRRYVKIASTPPRITSVTTKQGATDDGINWHDVATELDNSTKLLIRRDLELTRANQKLRQLDAMKSEFVSLVTHQLRTPLSGIRWSLSMLINGEMGEVTPEQKVFLMKTYESNNRMITLINDMLQADRVDSGTLKFKMTPTNLLYLVENVLSELRPIGEKRNIEIVLNAPKELPELVIDPENMRMVLQNLIENAIKYSSAGGKVDVAIEQKENIVEIAVSDHGIGIPKEYQKNIFKRFFRAPNAVRNETDGTGLGLYIVESIIHKHHGTIRFTSEENVGTTFYVTLMLQQPN